MAVGIYADAELMLYESGIFRALDRDFWRRTAGRTHPSYDPLTCHNVLKGFYDLFNWCKNDEEKAVLIAHSWNSACNVV